MKALLFTTVMTRLTEIQVRQTVPFRHTSSASLSIMGGPGFTEQTPKLQNGRLNESTF